MAKSQGTSVSEIVVPDDVIIEILIWLPVKSLLKFKCVCRSWRALISNRRFIRAHLENSKSAPNLAREMLAIGSGKLGKIRNLKVCSVNSMLYESVPPLFDLSYPLDFESGCMVVASCDGLLLLRPNTGEMILWPNNVEMILWNPSTRIWKTLPHFDLKFNIPEFDIGYDKSSDDYKVVAFYYHPETIVAVYSLRNDEWKRIKNISDLAMPDCEAVYGSSALANGKLYFFIEPDWDIVSLDLEKEEIEILQMPSYVKVIIHGSSLAVSEGSLFLLCPHLSMTAADVWILDGCSVGNGNWTKVVTMPCCPYGGWTYGFLLQLLYVQKNNGLVIFCGVGVDFVVYDAKDGSFRYHHIRDIGQYGYGTEHTYFESLVSPLG